MRRGTLVINLDPDKKIALIPRKIGRKYSFVEMGTPNGTAALQDPAIDTFSVDQTKIYEMTYFAMKRRRDGIWFAIFENPTTKIELGKSDTITYDIIMKTWNAFINSRKK